MYSSMASTRPACEHDCAESGAESATEDGNFVDVAVHVLVSSMSVMFGFVKLHETHP